MAEKANLTTKPSEPDKVDAYMKKLKHPPKPIVEALREVILGIDDEIGEEIKWNKPTFFYGGPMKAFNPKEYRRYIVVFNLYRKDCIRLIFPSGAKIGDKSGLLEGDYPTEGAWRYSDRWTRSRRNSRQCKQRSGNGSGYWIIPGSQSANRKYGVRTHSRKYRFDVAASVASKDSFGR